MLAPTAVQFTINNSRPVNPYRKKIHVILNAVKDLFPRHLTKVKILR